MKHDRASEEILPGQFGTRDCACHGEPMFWKRDNRRIAGGTWRCRVKGRDSRRLIQLRRRADGRHARTYANRLNRGEQTGGMSNHHKGMAELKSQMGDPRPPGLELSLVNYWGPDSYWGYSHRNGERVPYRLSTNPGDYVWETPAENAARRTASS